MILKRKQSLCWYGVISQNDTSWYQNDTFMDNIIGANSQFKQVLGVYINFSEEEFERRDAEKLNEEKAFKINPDNRAPSAFLL